MYKTCTKVRKRPDSECQRENVYLKHFETTGGYIDTTCPAYLARLRYVLLSKLFTFYSQFWINKDTTVFFSASLLTFICSTDIDTLQSTDTQRRSQDFQRGGVDFLLKRQSGERAKRALLTYVYASYWNWSPWWVPGWSPGRHSISLHLKASDCERIDILNAFFLSEFFQYNDDFYGHLYGDVYGDNFVATNFLISLFLFFPLYDFNFILLASERASQGASLANISVTPTDPTPLATRLILYSVRSAMYL